ncbi:MAG: hypothetical protein RR367_03550 [Clostridia bacterium]
MQPSASPSCQQRRAKAWVLLFFAILTAIGLLTLRDYSAPYDELVERAIVTWNMKEYAQHLPPSAHNPLAHYQQAKLSRISQTNERDHGAAPMYLYGLALPWLNDESASVLWSALVWCWFMAGVWALYACCRALGVSRPVGCFSALLLYLSPRFFAQGHYNNKDMVLLSLVLCTLWLGAQLLRQPGYWRGVLFSLAGALATNTKIAGMLPWGLMALGAVALLTLNRRWSARMAGVAAVTALSFAAFYALFTPALWNDPLFFFQYALSNAAQFSRWSGTLLFRGATFLLPDNPLPWYYLPYLIAVTLPLYTLPLAALGQWLAIREAFKGRRAFLASPRGLTLLALSLCWLLPLGYAMVGRPLIYNGWRHFYFVFAGIACLGGYGIDQLYKRLCTTAVRKRLGTALLSLCMLCSAAGIWANHPYQFAYYNPLAGGNASERMELDYWNVAGADAVNRLLRADRDESLPLTIGCYFMDYQNALFKMPPEKRALVTISVERDAPYLCYNKTCALLYCAQEPPEGYHMLFEGKSYGNVIYTMYERDQNALPVLSK